MNDQEQIGTETARDAAGSLDLASEYANAQELPDPCSLAVVRAKLVNAFLAGHCSGIEAANQIWNDRLASAQKEVGA